MTHISTSTYSPSVVMKKNVESKAVLPDSQRLRFEDMAFLNEPEMIPATPFKSTNTSHPESSKHMNKIQSTSLQEKGEDKKVREVADQFESMFIGMMLKSMRDTLSQDTMLGSSNEEKTYQSMLDQMYADNWSTSRSLGLSDMIVDFLTKNQSTMQASPLKIVEEWRAYEG